MIFYLRKIKFLILLLVITLISYLFYNVILKPFPFFKVDYFYKVSKFNSNPSNHIEFYHLEINKVANPLQINLIELDEVKKAKRFQKIKIATKLTRQIQEKSVGNDIKVDFNILSNDSSFKEICSESSKIFLYLMHLFGETARVLWLNGHTVTEVWDENNWIFVDTSSNTLAFDISQNKYLSFLELLNSNNLIEFEPIIEIRNKLWDFRDSPDRLYEIIEENNLVLVLNNKDVFNFHTNEEKINRISNSINLNSNYTAKQFIHNEKTPKVGNIGLNLYKIFLN